VSKNFQDAHLCVGPIHELANFLPLAVPQFSTAVSAGFPSPADDYQETKLDLNAYLIQHPHATFVTKVAGDSMVEAGIHSDDLLIVDRALEATSGQVVIAAIDGELTVKRLLKRGRKVYLQPANPNYPLLTLDEHNNCTVWGVVVYAIHRVR
jgi:DNA polymerase V